MCVCVYVCLLLFIDRRIWIFVLLVTHENLKAEGNIEIFMSALSICLSIYVSVCLSYGVRSLFASNFVFNSLIADGLLIAQISLYCQP